MIANLVIFYSITIIIGIVTWLFSKENKSAQMAILVMIAWPLMILYWLVYLIIFFPFDIISKIKNKNKNH
jgi:hypothetical protein